MGREGHKSPRRERARDRPWERAQADQLGVSAQLRVSSLLSAGRGSGGVGRAVRAWPGEASRADVEDRHGSSAHCHRFLMSRLCAGAWAASDGSVTMVGLGPGHLLSPGGLEALAESRVPSWPFSGTLGTQQKPAFPRVCGGPLRACCPLDPESPGGRVRRRGCRPMRLHAVLLDPPQGPGWWGSLWVD